MVIRVAKFDLVNELSDTTVCSSCHELCRSKMINSQEGRVFEIKEDSQIYKFGGHFFHERCIPGKDFEEVFNKELEERLEKEPIIDNCFLPMQDEVGEVDLEGGLNEFNREPKGFSVSRFITNNPFFTCSLVAAVAIGIMGIHGSVGAVGTYCIEQNDRVRYCVDHVLEGATPNEGFVKWVPATFTRWVPSDELITKTLEQVQNGNEVFMASFSSLFAKNPFSLIAGYFR